jgi:hypothetical protein
MDPSNPPQQITESPSMNGRTIARILLVIVVVAGAIGLGVSAYNAGVTAGLVQSGEVSVTPGGVPVVPVGPYVGYGWGYGWGVGHGFGFFGFFGFLLILFLFFGLLRAAFGGHRRGWGGPGGPGAPNGWNRDWRRDAWEQRVKETHDALHRENDAKSSDTEPS